MIINLRKTSYILLAVVVLALAIRWGISEVKKPAVNVALEDNKNTPDALDNKICEILDKNSKSNFFSEYRMERERLRGRQIEMLQDIINNPTTEKKAREAASLRLVNITGDMEKEMKAENLVKSKGYKECVVIIQPENTTVVVQASNLRLDQENDIKKLIGSAVQCSEENISLIVRDSV